MEGIKKVRGGRDPGAVETRFKEPGVRAVLARTTSPSSQKPMGATKIKCLGAK